MARKNAFGEKASKDYWKGFKLSCMGEGGDYMVDVLKRLIKRNMGVFTGHWNCGDRKCKCE